MTTSPFAERFRDLRSRASLTQNELATNAGVSQATISGIEKGSLIPERKTLRRLLHALGLFDDGREQERLNLVQLAFDAPEPTKAGNAEDAS